MAQPRQITPAYEHVALAPNQLAYLETRHRIEVPSDSTLHFHEFAELIYFKKVKGWVYFNREKIELVDNSVLYIPGNMPHAFQIEDIMELHLFQCTSQLWTSFNPDFLHHFSESPFYAHLHGDVWERFNQLFQWYFEARHHSSNNLQQDLLKLVSWAFYELIDLNTQNNQAPSKSRDQYFFEPFIKNVDQQLNMSLDQAASLCHVTRSHFSRKFKTYFGISFSTYLEKRKIEKAKSLLANTAYNMTEIAHQCGFNNSSYFSSTFKKHTQLSPLEMRKHLLQEKIRK